MSTFYTLQINEAQRVLLHDLLMIANESDADFETNEEQVLLQGMLASLPADEETSPGAVHAFHL